MNGSHHAMQQHDAILVPPEGFVPLRSLPRAELEHLVNEAVDSCFRDMRRLPAHRLRGRKPVTNPKILEYSEAPSSATTLPPTPVGWGLVERIMARARAVIVSLIPSIMKP